ncbi:MAG: outer membrane protein OmpK [Shewanella sp.]
MYILKSIVLSASTLAMVNFAVADVIYQNNNIIVGYEYLLDAEDNNPNLYDQPYLVLSNTTIADWGSAIGWLRFENPTDSAENQQGKDAGATTKVWLKLDHNIADTPFNFWFQSFTNLGKVAEEQNFYIGGSYDVNWGKLKGTIGVGMQYAYGSFAPTGKSFNGSSGFATTILFKYPLKDNLISKYYYEAQFERSGEHRDVLGYDSYGHQAVIGLDYYITPKFFVGTQYKHRKNWGGALNDGGELFFEAGYNF